MIAYFADRFAEESRETLVKQIVALVGTFSNEELCASYEESREENGGRGKPNREC